MSICDYGMLIKTSSNRFNVATHLCTVVSSVCALPYIILNTDSQCIIIRYQCLHLGLEYSTWHSLALL